MGETQVSLPWELCIAWSDGTRIFYNLRFSCTSALPRQSYSVPLRPDIALFREAGPHAGLHLFDAKFRLEDLATVLPTESENADEFVEVDEERRGTSRRGDLYKMHAYRDAIPKARSVWILYPGSEFRFFRSDSCQIVAIDELRTGKIEGVGAVPALPAASGHPELVGVLKHLVATTGAVR